MPGLVYPWDAIKELSRLAQPSPEGDVDPSADARKSFLEDIFASFERTFEGVSIKDLTSLHDTRSHTVAEALLAYIYRAENFSPKWFTLTWAAHSTLTFVSAIIDLACCTYSLSTGSASMRCSMLDLIKGHRMAYQQDANESIFEDACSAGFLVITGMDNTFFDVPKAATVFSALFAERVSTPHKRTVILLEMPDVIMTKGTTGMSAMDFFNSSGTVCIPAASKSGLLPAPESVSWYPDKVDKTKCSTLKHEAAAVFKESKMDTLTALISLIGQKNTAKLNSYSDSFFIYNPK